MSDVRHQNLGVLRLRHALGAVAVVVAGLTVEAGSSHAQSASPEIRTSAANPMPACVTPERLMAYLEERNPSLDPRFKDIARIFKQQGEALQEVPALRTQDDDGGTAFRGGAARRKGRVGAWTQANLNPRPADASLGAFAFTPAALGGGIHRSVLMR